MWHDRWGHVEMMGWGDGTWPWLMMGLHGVFWVLIIGVAIAAVLFLFRAYRRPADVSEARTAVSVLDTRYARGEIDRGEYLERKRDMS